MAWRPSEGRSHPPPPPVPFSVSPPASVPTLSRTCFLGPSKPRIPTDKQGLEQPFVLSQISKTGKEIKDYVEAEAGNDPLLKGVPEDKNPFKEKGGCMIS